jgi:hypothetical protein
MWLEQYSLCLPLCCSFEMLVVNYNSVTKYNIIKAYGGVKVKLYSFLLVVLEGHCFMQ